MPSHNWEQALTSMPWVATHESLWAAVLWGMGWQVDPYIQKNKFKLSKRRKEEENATKQDEMKELAQELQVWFEPMMTQPSSKTNTAI
jgi:hypothetical protein